MLRGYNIKRKVNYKKNKTAIFYENLVKIEGREIYYDNIEGVGFMYEDVTHTALYMFPVARTLTGNTALYVKNEKKPVAISITGKRILGITFGQAPQNAQKEFGEMFDIIDLLITTRIAQRYLEQIYAGDEVEVAGLLIKQESAVGKRRKDTIIDKENYGGMQHTFNHGIVLDKDGEHLWRMPLTGSAKNVTVLPYILDELFLIT